MQQAPAWEADGSAASREIPCILWNTEVHHRIHKIPPLIPWLKSHKSGPISSHLRLGLPSGHFSSDLPNKILHAFLFSRTNATCPTHPILLDMITPVVYGEVYKPWSSSLCNFLQFPELKHQRYIIIIIIITTTTTTCMQCIYNYIPEKNHVQYGT